MSGVRVPFDPRSPFVVACGDLPCGAQRFTRGDAFPWRGLVTEYELRMLWIAGQVECVDPPAIEHVAPPPSAPTPKKPQPRR